MTMHASKGLEFPIVFIAGCEESLIPHRSPDREDNDIQEERRLFYVAMTRAMERLYLTRARSDEFMDDGSTVNCPNLLKISKTRLKLMNPRNRKTKKRTPSAQCNLSFSN